MLKIRCRINLKNGCATRSLPGGVTPLADISVRNTHTIKKIALQFWGSEYHLLLFSLLWSTKRPTVTAVVLCHKMLDRSGMENVNTPRIYAMREYF